MSVTLQSFLVCFISATDFLSLSPLLSLPSQISDDEERMSVGSRGSLRVSIAYSSVPVPFPCLSGDLLKVSSHKGKNPVSWLEIVTSKTLPLFPATHQDLSSDFPSLKGKVNVFFKGFFFHSKREGRITIHIYPHDQTFCVCEMFVEPCVGATNANELPH